MDSIACLGRCVRGLLKQVRAADIPDMGFFWFWIVRAPFALAALLFLAGGALSVIDWSLALMGLAFFTLVADAAHHIGGHVRRREAAVLLAFEAVEEPKVMRGRLIDQHASDQSRAA